MIYPSISVDEALSKGQRMINYPALAIFILGPILTVWVVDLKKLPFWTIPIGFVLVIALSTLWWSIMITKWRLWAFDGVRNVHELKK